MQKSIPESKSALRQQVRASLKQLNVAHRRAAAANACKLLEKQDVWKKAQSVLFFAPLPEELDIWPLAGDALEAGKIVGLLRFNSGTNQYEPCRIQNPVNDLRNGQFGIREPVAQCPALPPDQFELILVPGVAFDLKGHRLGRGRGTYDRLLTRVRGVTCGVGFDEQIVPEIPVEAHDLHVKIVLTPTRWVEPGR
jgi:5-formyltetrahydrofolate cyclo-ligase